MKTLHIHTGRGDLKAMPGYDACQIHLNWNVNSNICPWKRGKINGRFIRWIKEQVFLANNRGMTPVIILGSTTELRKPNFNTHALNAANGGPLNAAGKRSVVPDFYQDKKCRKIIKEILDIISGLDGKLEIMVMWETFIYWDSGIIYNFDLLRHWMKIDSRPIGTGNPYCYEAARLQLNIMLVPECRPPRFYVEAWNYEKWSSVNREYLRNPDNPELDIQFIGVWPSLVLFYENRRNKKEREAYFDQGKEIENVIYQLTDAYRMIINGCGPSGHFRVFTLPKYWKEKYDIDTGKYDFKKHQAAVDGFFRLPAVQKAVKNPEIIKTDAGRRAFLRAAINYRNKLRRSK